MNELRLKYRRVKKKIQIRNNVEMRLIEEECSEDQLRG